MEEGRIDEKEAPRAQEGRKKARGGMSRRTLCVGTAAAAALLCVGGVGRAAAQSITRPPGGQDEENLWGSCIRCEKCYEVCPRSVIAPAKLESGIINVRTPTLNFSDNWCDWCQEENGGKPLCVSSCPTQALRLAPGAVPETVILGKAVLNEDLCLAYRLTGCRFCYDACEYEAMALNEVGQPSVIADKCNGCGACESVCVSLQNGSIAGGADRRAIIVVPADQAEGE